MFKQNLHTSSTILKTKLEHDKLQFLTNETEAKANKGKKHKEEYKHLQKSAIKCMYHTPSSKRKKRNQLHQDSKILLGVNIM